MATIRSPPLRQVRGTKLNTIIEEVKETGLNYGDQPPSPPQLKLQTTDLAAASEQNLPASAPMSSACSDTEWQRQMQGLDELYDATDIESTNDDSASASTSQSASATNPTAEEELTSLSTRNCYPTLTIPPSHWSFQPPKNSPIPPTPPPKIPVSPAALLKLGHSVPAVHAPPSLDGSVSSDQPSAPATPDLQSVPDDDWNTQEVQIQLDLDSKDANDAGISDLDASSESQNVEIAIETDKDWQRILGSFPPVPTRPCADTTCRGTTTSTPLSLDLDIEPAREPTPSDRGINLPENALDMLKHIHLDATFESSSETSEQHEEQEMWQVDPSRDRPRSAGDATPASALSDHSFTGLSVPSPGGFFAELTPRTRHTWSFPRNHNAPSSAAAENFYNLPFSQHESGEIVEQVIECPERRSENGESTAVPVLEGPLTAVRLPPQSGSPVDQGSPVSPSAISEIPGAASFANTEYDENYTEELQRKAMASLDRTSVWLAAQESDLAALSEANPIDSMNNETNPTNAPDNEGSGRGSSESNREKAVFCEAPPAAVSSHPSATASDDSIYWRGFQFLHRASGQQENFIHRNIRFDAIQSNRLGLTQPHVDRLAGNYELVRQKRPSYTGPFTQAPRHSKIISILEERFQFSLLEKEQLVLAQIQQSLWAMDALRYLNGGHLLACPASRQLSKSTSSGSPQKNSRHLRVLDLGGHASCEWGWYLAHDRPSVSVYTVYTDQQKVNLGIKGPPNHHPVSVSNLWKLPFGNNKFDVISARSLPALLKTERPVGEDQDEYDLCLQECYRCLKPGGHLEFFTMDAELAHAGPYTSATSVEFAFNLRTRGYDPSPTKNFLCRLRKANLVGIKRAWMFLPMGVEPVKRDPPRTPAPDSDHADSGSEAEEDLIGRTADIASLSGLFGGWMWEQWLLKLQVEMGRDGDRLLEGIGGVFDEGRKNGAGWTCLSGWAMKPRKTRSHGLGK